MSVAKHPVFLKARLFYPNCHQFRYFIKLEKAYTETRFFFLSLCP